MTNQHIRWGRVRQLLCATVVAVLLAACAPSPAVPPTAVPSPAIPPTAIPSPAVTPPALASAQSATPTPRPDGLSPEQAATLASLTKVDDYPLYTMRYDSMARSGDFSRLSQSRTTEVVTTNTTWACSLFAALGSAENRLYGRNFDWDFSPALLLFYDPPDGYASASMVDIAYFGFGDRSVDLTKLPLAGRRALLETPFWPFDGMNEAGVAIGMAALPQAQAPYAPGKTYIGSLRLIREILDHAGTVDEAVGIIGRYNLGWEGGPPLHYLVADRSGRAALIEFYNGQTIVRPNEGAWHAATNFTRSAVAGDAAGTCWRYDSLVRRLTDSGGRLAAGEALDLLQTVAQPSKQWSVVYGMSTGTVEVVMGRRYERVHAFRLGEE